MADLAGIVTATPRLERPTLVAVDGVDGSGKTTLADRLATEYRGRDRVAIVVHLDDFLNPRTIRYRKGRASPEGYFLDTYDLGAFAASVLEPLRPGGSRRILLRAFDFRADRPVAVDPVVVPDEVVVVVEGMLLHRDELAAMWDLSVFLQVPFTVSVGRMARRDGTSPYPGHPSLARYVEGQRLYLERCTPAERATYVVESA